jgi:antitoxin component HigA of HigAB toxin-antitoxin module
MKSSSNTLSKSLSALPESYIRLLAEFQLRPIRTVRDYELAAKIVHRLALRDRNLDAGEQAYLEVLEGIVERYDRDFSLPDIDRVTPTQLLRLLVAQANMSVTELGKLLGSKGAASELLSGKRAEPSKAQIAKLCVRFKVNASAFLLRPAAPAHAA